MQQPECDVFLEQPSDVLSVVCLCAEWCGTCREYQSEFGKLADAFPGARFSWWDIEERADRLGDLDIENFPTLLIRRGPLVLFYGTMLPQIGLLRRLIGSFLEQTEEEARRYAFSSPERCGWQSNVDLSQIDSHEN